MAIDITFKKHQVELKRKIDKSKAHFFVFPIGRRWGKTHFFIEYAKTKLSEAASRGKKIDILWGDTTSGNVTRYIQRFFIPFLNQFPKSKWSHNKSLGQINFYGSTIDFRYATKPENWEGFEYDYIFLNEFGIIGKNTLLWEESVLAMGLDREAKFFLFGVPKGQYSKDGEHVFYKLCKQAEHDEDFLHYHAKTSDRALIDPKFSQEAVDRIGANMDPITREQELDAKFVNKVGLLWLYCFRGKDEGKNSHIKELKPNWNLPFYLWFDFNVNPFVCSIHQKSIHNNGKYWWHTIDEVFLPRETLNPNKTWTENICDIIQSRYGKKGQVTYFIGGDKTSWKSEITLLPDQNAYTQIMNNLGATEQYLELKQNPELSGSQEICNSIVSKPDVFDWFVDPKCKELIKDMETVKTDEGGHLEKPTGGQKGMRSHLLDSWRYFANAYFSDFITEVNKYWRHVKKA